MATPRHTWFDWTDHRIATLKKLWAEGHSCSHIAARMGGGLTRNAVIGKVSRLGLAKRLPQNARHSGRQERQHPNANRKPRRKPFTFGALPRPRQERAPGTATPPIPAPALEPSDMKRVPLLDRRAGQCAFPLWSDGDDHRDCCGNATLGLGAYCAQHARIAFQPIHPKKKWADDDPRRFAFAARARQTFNVAAE